MATRYLATAPKYIILRNSDPDVLATAVTEKLREGYEVCGSLVSLQGNVVAQTLTQYTEVVPPGPAP
jgi:hypothetical protein